MTEQNVIPPARAQRAMMVKNLTPRLPERGRVKIGELGEVRKSRSGNDWQMPVKLDHFKVTTLERGHDGNFVADREFHGKHGDRPTEIPIRLIYDAIELNAPTRYACYAGKTLWCSGDGEMATRISGRYGDKALPEPLTVQCPCHRQDPGYQGKDKCKLNVSLSFLIEGMGGVGGVWKLRSTSWNTTTGLLSSMAFLRSITGGILANIPLRLRLQPKQATNPVDQSPVLIYVVTLEFPGDIAALQQIGHQIALDRATTHLSIANIEEEARRQLALPGPANAILPGDDPDDVVAEFYPEQNNGGAAPPRPTREQFTETPETPHGPETGEITQVALSAAEEADLAALVKLGDAAAEAGPEMFAKYWNEGATKAYRNELAPRLDAWSAIAKTASDQTETDPFDVIDMVGDVIGYPDVDNAIGAYREAMEEAERQNGEAGITLVWNNNQGFMRALDERGFDAVSKELSMEYGERRQAAANREMAEREAEEAAISQNTSLPELRGASHAAAEEHPGADPSPVSRPGAASPPSLGLRSNDAAGRSGAASADPPSPGVVSPGKKAPPPRQSQPANVTVTSARPAQPSNASAGDARRPAPEDGVATYAERQSKAIEVPTIAGKPEWRTWLLGQVLPKLKQAMDSNALADLLGDNDENITAARRVLAAADLKEFDSARTAQWDVITKEEAKAKQGEAR